MLFNSFGFIFLFLPITLLIAKKLKGQNLLRFISLASFTFYAFAGHVWFLVPMLITTCLDFYIGQKMEIAADPVRKRLLLYISLAGNLGLLIYFKYSGLFLTTATSILHAARPGIVPPAWFSFFNVILPAGISFYTFQTLSYVIDVYRGTCEAEHNFWQFAGFVSFFPHLVAGPLTRHNQLIPSLARISREGIKPRYQDGIYLFVLGLSKKVLIADRIANYIDPQITNVHQMGMVSAWMCAFGYALQIYFDFSGYSDMAIGIARLFDIELPQNFNRPYVATNPSDFWRRWHITLSLWLRDYLYISLGGNRCSKRRRQFNLIATMVLGGLWHGANWTFAVWGLFHGVLLVAHHEFEAQWEKIYRPLQILITFLLVCVGWVFFRAPDFSQAWTWLSRMAGTKGLDLAGLTAEHTQLALFLLAGFIVIYTFPAASSRERRWNLGIAQQVGLGLLASIVVLLMTHSSRFLYFQF